MPMMQFASNVKTDWTHGKDLLLSASEQVCSASEQTLKVFDGIRREKFSQQESDLLIKNSISENPMSKLLVLRESIHSISDISLHTKKCLLLALAKTAVKDVSNLHFGPEVGVKNIREDDVNVFEKWRFNLYEIAEDLEKYNHCGGANSRVILHDSTRLTNTLDDESIGFVFTSPPYPNEKDYSRATRLESVLLGFLKDKKQLRATKQNLIRSNTRNVYVGDEKDLLTKLPNKVHELADQIEKKRTELDKSSGFEKNYHRVVRLYFGGMANHLSSLRPYLRNGAILAYVVGDQASFFRIQIATGQILAEIAESLGYRILNIDLFRTRRSTVTRQELREEVVIFQWVGHPV